jgi:hypothetical protein
MFGIIVFCLLVGILFIILLTNTNSPKEIPEIVHVENESITSFIRNVALAKSHTNLPVPILSIGEPLYNGLFVLQTNLSLFSLAKMGLELKNEQYKHRHNFEVITISSFRELFLPFIKLLAQPKCHLICKSQINLKQIAKLDDTLFVYELEQEKRCVSQVIFNTIYRECKLDQMPHITYYVTSTQREEEVRVAYKDDRSFIVRTVTGLIHACVLKAMFPDINIVINHQDTYNDPLYDSVKKFCNCNFF